MGKRSATFITLLVALLAIAGPIVLAVYVAYWQARDAEMSRVLAYARDVLNRSDATADQIGHAFRELAALKPARPCSPQSVARMKNLDLASSYIQAIGYMSGDRLQCSSLGDAERGLYLGPVDLVQPSGATLRLNVELPFAKGTPFLVVERGGYAAVVHKDLPIDISTDTPDVSLAVVAGADGRILISRGFIDSRWPAALLGRREVTLIED